MQLDFITVVFDEEVSLLPWQAKSICRYVDPSMINKIILVDNGSQQCAIDPAWYGKLCDKVEVITHKDLKLKVFQSLDGWRTQQLCKILASARSTLIGRLCWMPRLFLPKHLTKQNCLLMLGRVLVLRL
jgi:hypothetical protein